MPETITLSIAIVNWNAGQYMLDCLATIFNQPPKSSFDIWLVDNASTDGSTARAQAAYPQIKAIVNHENLGFAAANNQVIQACDGSYVLLLNPDTLCSPGSLQTLVDFLESHPQAGAAGPCLNNPDGSLQVSCFPFLTLTRELWRLLHLDKLYPYAVYPAEKWPQDQPQAVDSLQGACLLLRRAALDQAGVLDPGYFMYTEEIDLCYRLNKAGWPLFWIPSARVVHFGGRSTSQVPESMFLNLYRSKVRFFRQHRGRFTAGMYKLVLLLASLLRLAAAPLALLEKPGRRAAHLQLARQYWKLVRSLPRY